MEGVIFTCTDINNVESPADENTIYNMGCYLHLVQSIMKEWSLKLPKMVVVTRGVIPIGDFEPGGQESFRGAGVLGMFKTFLSEKSEVVGKYIDLEPYVNTKEKCEEMEVMQVLYDFYFPINFANLIYFHNVFYVKILV